MLSETDACPWFGLRVAVVSLCLYRLCGRVLQGLVRPCLNPRGYFLRKGIDASCNIGWAVLMVSGLHLHQHDGLAWFWPAADSHRYAPTLISIAGVGNMSLSVTSARGERPARRNVRIARLRQSGFESGRLAAGNVSRGASERWSCDRGKSVQWARYVPCSSPRLWLQILSTRGCETAFGSIVYALS